MSNMRHLLEFRHREFATFLRSRGTLPPLATARPRPRLEQPPALHVASSAPVRTSALPLPPLPALPNLSHASELAAHAAAPVYAASHIYAGPRQMPSTLRVSSATTTVGIGASSASCAVPSDIVGQLDQSKDGLSVMTEAHVKNAPVASFSKSSVGSARKRAREYGESSGIPTKRKKESNIGFVGVTSPTAVAANVITPRSGTGPDFEAGQAREGTSLAAGMGTRSSSETEEVDESVITPGFDCELCNTRFYRKHHLERHIQNIHEGQRPWTCDQCGFAFHQKPNLERHIMTVHEEQKPFRCEVCKMSFGRKGVLKKHVQMVHEHSRKFECEICRIPFGLKSDLKRHVQSVHQKKRPFVCEVCSASFGRRSDLKRHTLSLHPGAEVPTRKNSGPSRQDVS